MASLGATTITHHGCLVTGSQYYYAAVALIHLTHTHTARCCTSRCTARLDVCCAVECALLIRPGPRLGLLTCSIQRALLVVRVGPTTRSELAVVPGIPLVTAAPPAATQRPVGQNSSSSSSSTCGSQARLRVGHAQRVLGAAGHHRAAVYPVNALSPVQASNIQTPPLSPAHTARGETLLLVSARLAATVNSTL
jgi:hypothetical protein